MKVSEAGEAFRMMWWFVNGVSFGRFAFREKALN